MNSTQKQCLKNMLVRLLVVVGSLIPLLAASLGRADEKPPASETVASLAGSRNLINELAELVSHPMIFTRSKAIDWRPNPYGEDQTPRRARHLAYAVGFDRLMRNADAATKPLVARARENWVRSWRLNRAELDFGFKMPTKRDIKDQWIRTVGAGLGHALSDAADYREETDRDGRVHRVYDGESARTRDYAEEMMDGILSFGAGSGSEEESSKISAMRLEVESELNELWEHELWPRLSAQGGTASLASNLVFTPITFTDRGSEKWRKPGGFAFGLRPGIVLHDVVVRVTFETDSGHSGRWYAFFPTLNANERCEVVVPQSLSAQGLCYSVGGISAKFWLLCAEGQFAERAVNAASPVSSNLAQLAARREEIVGFRRELLHQSQKIWPLYQKLYGDPPNPATNRARLMQALPLGARYTRADPPLPGFNNGRQPFVLEVIGFSASAQMFSFRLSGQTANGLVHVVYTGEFSTEADRGPVIGLRRFYPNRVGKLPQLVTDYREIIANRPTHAERSTLFGILMIAEQGRQQATKVRTAPVSEEAEYVLFFNAEGKLGLQTVSPVEDLVRYVPLEPAKTR